jgi:hypothetical protein
MFTHTMAEAQGDVTNFYNTTDDQANKKQNINTITAKTTTFQKQLAGESIQKTKTQKQIKQELQSKIDNLETILQKHQGVITIDTIELTCNIITPSSVDVKVEGTSTLTARPSQDDMNEEYSVDKPTTTDLQEHFIIN